ncbi:MAG: hypothetical protein QM655_12920 [Nocardioidaceae bacterium]
MTAMPAWLEWLVSGLFLMLGLVALVGGAIWVLSVAFGGEMAWAYKEYLPDIKGVRKLSDDQVERIVAEWRRTSIGEDYRSGYQLVQPHGDDQGLERLRAAAEVRGGGTGLVAAVTTAYLATTYQHRLELAQFEALTDAWMRRKETR